MQETLKEKTAKGLLWGGLSNSFMELLNLIFGIFLARILSKSDYGMVGVLALFPALANIFLEGGFIAAIVNKKEAHHSDYNALFWFNLFGGIVVYFILYCCAPLIATFNHTPELKPLARFLFLGFVFSSLGTAPSAYFFRNLLVKERAKIQMISMLISGVIGVAAALCGCRYWGIALQTIMYTGLTSALLWIRSPWKPTLDINFRPLHEMWGFSSKMLITYLFNQVNVNVFSLVLGRCYNIEQVGIYSQGNKWTAMGCSSLVGMINGVAQPVLHEANTDVERLRSVFRKMLRFTVFISFPSILGLGLVSRELIHIAVTDKWLSCVPIMQILCIWGACTPISTLYSNLMNGIGRPQCYMWNTIGLGIAQLIGILLSVHFGLLPMLYVFVMINILWLFIWQGFAKHYIGLRFIDVLHDILPYSIISCLVLATAYICSLPFSNAIITLLVKMVVSSSLYIFILWRLDSTAFKESVKYLRRK